MKTVIYEEKWLEESREHEKSIRLKSVKDLCNSGDITQMRYNLRNLLDFIERKMKEEE